MMANDFISVVYEYVNTLLLLDASGVYFGARDLRTHCAALLRVVGAIGDIDVATAVAEYREQQPVWSRPDFTGEGSVVMVDLCHPLLEAPVPNSISLHLGEGMLVTGSNMSGKSTFLRTIGVNAVMARTLNTCLAREYRAPRFRVRSCIGRADDLSAGKSYYVVEVEALVALIQASQSTEPHLILLDELFHGTNAVERIAAAEAVLRELIVGSTGSKPHLVVAATHDHELLSLLAGLYAPYHFGDAIGDDGPVFDHRLKTGPSTTRTALALLKQKGAPETLLTRAESTASRLDAEPGRWHGRTS
jgi:DNA mismatch repair ATPase MutS